MVFIFCSPINLYLVLKSFGRFLLSPFDTYIISH
nr:MAG TPA: hypothetical protein [Caudoviricetes sp.]